MLKLIQNEIPTWAIDSSNVEYDTENIIGTIQSVYVDWALVTAYTSNILTIILEVAPVSTIVVNYFYREVSAIRWTWEITLWNLKDDFYRKIGRLNENWTIPTNLNKLYPEDYVKEQLRKTIKRIWNKTPNRTRLQQYSFLSTNWYQVDDTTTDYIITFKEKLTEEINWVFLTDKWALYEYYDLVWNTFHTADIDVTSAWDKIIVWHRLPYWVKKVSSVQIDWDWYVYKDERQFDFAEEWYYTTMKDFQWNEYLFLPYSATEKTYTIKYTPNLGDISDDNDILDIPDEYTDLFVYDVAYKLLRDKEDERWAWLKEEIWTGKRQWLLYEYQSHMKSNIDKPRAQIGFAKT